MAQTSRVDTEAQLADAVADYYADLLGFVMFAYDWDNDPSLHLVKLPEPWASRYNSVWGPDTWFCELADRVGEQVENNAFDGMHPVKAILEAIASGHGIGKSAGVAWIVDWIMSTRPNARGTITATTAAQLETRTWAEIAKWTKKCITGHWFDVSTGRGSMKMVHKDYPEKWFCSAQTCREENSDAFAGQHAADSTSFYVFDEGSGVPDKIWEVAFDGGLTDGEPMFFAFGNPTTNSGEFHACFHGKKHRWNTCQIDSRDVQITNKDKIAEMIADHGINSDRVKVRVRGIFPSMSAKQFVSVEDADAGLDRHLEPHQYNFAPIILTCDPAWEGDDILVIGKRQGLRFDVLRKMPKNDNDIQVANILAHLEDEHHADGVIIDKGYGTGVYSAGKTMGRDWLLADFGSKSPDPGCLNLRAFMAKGLRDWLKAGGSYHDRELYKQLISVQTVPRIDGAIQIESKQDMKKRGLPSPNEWDALGLSFAFPIAKKQMPSIVPQRGGQGPEGHNPYDRTLDGSNREHDPYTDM